MERHPSYNAILGHRVNTIQRTLRQYLLLTILDEYGGRWTDNTKILNSQFFKTISIIGIIGAFIAFTVTSFSLRTISLSYDTLGPWPDSFDYTYGAVGLLHGTYNIIWYRCPLVYAPSSNEEITQTTTRSDCADSQSTPRKSYYTPGTSILMVPFVAIGNIFTTGNITSNLGGDEWATLLDYVSAVACAAVITIFLWRHTSPPFAFIGLLVYLLSPAQSLLSSMALSDLPTALLLLASSLLIASTNPYALIISGITSGWLVWMRPQMALVAPIGLLVLVLIRHKKNKLLLHAVPLFMCLALLGIWQWVYYGNPLTTGYQYNDDLKKQGISLGDTGNNAAIASQFNAPPSLKSDQSHTSFSDFFSSYYLQHTAWHADQTIVGGGWIDLNGEESNIPSIPNLPYYLLLLLGVDNFLLPIGFGLAGYIGLNIMIHDKSKTMQSIGVIGLYSTMTILVTYTFYYYRSGRFFVPVVPFLVIGAIILLYRLSVLSAHTIKLLLINAA